MTLRPFSPAAVNPNDFLFSDISGEAYSAFEKVYSAGSLIERDYFFTDVTGKPYTGYATDLSVGGSLIGKKYLYTGVTGETYTTYEDDYDGGGCVRCSTGNDGNIRNRNYYFANTGNAAWCRMRNCGSFDNECGNT